MTDTVKGAGRRRAVARTKKVDANKARVDEINRDRATGTKQPSARKTVQKVVSESTKPKRKPVKKPAPKKRVVAKKEAPAAKTVASAVTAVGAWDTEVSLGNNVDRLKSGGMTWRGIAELASANGHDIPWPDGGKLLRARKGFLAGTEGQTKARAPRKSAGQRASRSVSPDDDRPYTEQATERFKQALETRSVPWDSESTPEEIMDMLEGKRISFVSKVTGFDNSTRIIRSQKHMSIKEGEDGPYVTFVSEDGPFMSISLSRILHVS